MAANEGIELENYITLLRSTGMTWSRIAQLTGINRRELFRLRSTMSADQTFTVVLSDQELWAEIYDIKMENPHFGEVYVKAALLSRGFKICRARIRDIIHLMDPEGIVQRQKPKICRGVYSVPGAMYIWHTDGNEKMNMFKIYIHGCVDGHSRYPIYVNCVNNKKANTTLNMFYDATLCYGLPRFLRMDKGGENIKYAEFMEINGEMLGRERSVLVGPSTKNVRVERYWREINDITRPFKHFFFALAAEGLLDTSDPIHLFALHYVFIPRIQKSLNEFVATWNVHGIRTAHSDSPSAMFLTERYGDFTPVIHHPVFDPEEDTEEEEIYTENKEFAESVIPDPLAEDGNFGKNLYLQLVNACYDSVAQ